MRVCGSFRSAILIRECPDQNGRPSADAGVNGVGRDPYPFPACRNYCVLSSFHISRCGRESNVGDRSIAQHDLTVVQ